MILYCRMMRLLFPERMSNKIRSHNNLSSANAQGLISGAGSLFLAVLPLNSCGVFLLCNK